MGKRTYATKFLNASQTGFSLLEALVAVALISAAFLPLLALQGQLSRTVVAMERAEDRVKNMTSALSYLRVVNPSLQNDGQQRIGDAQLTWAAQPISEERAVLDVSGSPGRFVARLYDIHATLAYEDGRQAAFTVRAMGWRPTAPVSAQLD